MTYLEFLLRCKKLIATKAGREDLTRTEFAKACSTEGKPYTATYMRNILEGYQKPGRDLLEAAAIAAGFDFEECISIPLEMVTPLSHRRALLQFNGALQDKALAGEAIELALFLDEKKKRQRRQKTGGRSHKKQ